VFYFALKVLVFVVLAIVVLECPTCCMFGLIYNALLFELIISSEREKLTLFAFFEAV